MLFVYDLIEELCMEKGITITTLCRECKIARSTMTDYKKGRIKTLSADALCKIADYFGVSVDYICGVNNKISQEEIAKKVLFGDDYFVSDEIWNDIKEYAQNLKSRSIARLL